MVDEIKKEETSELAFQEFTSCKDLAIFIKIKQKDIKKSKNEVNEKVILKDCYILAEQFTYDPEQTEQPLFIYAMTENPFQTIKINLPSKKMDIKPIYKTFEYSISGTNNTELIYQKPIKVDLTMLLNISFDEEKGIVVVNLLLDKVDEKAEVENNIVPKEKAISILKEYPFLIGFAGIKKMIMPILFDDDAVFQELKGIDYITFTGKGFSQFLTRVEIFGYNSRQEIKVPVFITKPKIYVNMSNLDKDEITLMRAVNYQVDNYTFSNSTTFIPILFGDISKTIADLESTNQISELKMATYVNSIVVKEYKEEIETLIKTNPLSIDDIKETSMTVDEIKIFTQIASMLIKDKYKFKKEDLQIIKTIYNAKTLLADNKPFASRDIEILLSIIAFYNTAKAKNPEYKEGQAQSLQGTIKAIIDRQYQIPLVDFKNTFMRDYGVSENKFEEITKVVIEDEGYIEIREENNTEHIVLAKSIETFLGE